MKKQYDCLRYNTIEEQLRYCQQQLKTIIQEKTEALKHAPTGDIHVSSGRNGSFRYYLRNKSSSKGETYISKKENEYISALLQKKYDLMLLKYAVKEVKAIDSFLKKACPVQLPGMERYEQDKFTVRQLIQPEELFRKQWESYAYEKKGFRPDYPEYYTERGERVRSKSEVMIANMLLKLGIPYRYEAPAKIGGQLYHPDFTLLGPKTHREYLWEHLGMMDDLGYVRDAMERIREYEHAGHFIGDNLIVTFESAQAPINMKDIERKIKTLVK